MAQTVHLLYCRCVESAGTKVFKGPGSSPVNRTSCTTVSSPSPYLFFCLHYLPVICPAVPSVRYITCPGVPLFPASVPVSFCSLHHLSWRPFCVIYHLSGCPHCSIIYRLVCLVVSRHPLYHLPWCLLCALYLVLSSVMVCQLFFHLSWCPL